MIKIRNREKVWEKRPWKNSLLNIPTSFHFCIFDSTFNLYLFPEEIQVHPSELLPSKCCFIWRRLIFRLYRVSSKKFFVQNGYRPKYFAQSGFRPKFFGLKVFRPRSFSVKFGRKTPFFLIRYKSIAVIFAVKNGSFETEILLDPESYQLRQTSVAVWSTKRKL